MLSSHLRPLLALTLLVFTSPALADDIAPRNPPSYQQPNYAKPVPKGNVSFEKQFSGPNASRRLNDRVEFLGILCPPGSGPNPNGPGGCAPCRPLHKGDPVGSCRM